MPHWAARCTRMVCSSCSEGRAPALARRRLLPDRAASDQRVSAVGQSSFAKARSIARRIPIGRIEKHSFALELLTTLGVRTLSIRNRPMDAW